jgi:hypothetical protein
VEKKGILEIKSSNIKLKSSGKHYQQTKAEERISGIEDKVDELLY